jgi:hypothetical protein
MENVTDTCIKNCVFFEKYMQDGNNCPFYMQTTWLDEKSGQPKICNDCAPKRSLMLQVEDFNRMQGLQRAFDEQRNKTAINTDIIVQMAMRFNTMVKEVFMKHLEIPYEDVMQIELAEESEENCEKQEIPHSDE